MFFSRLFYLDLLLDFIRIFLLVFLELVLQLLNLRSFFVNSVFEVDNLCGKVLLECELGVFCVLNFESEFFVCGFKLSVGCFESEEVLLHRLVLRRQIVNFLGFGSDFFNHFFTFVSILIGSELGIMLKLLDFELEFCEDPLVVLKECLNLIVIGIDNHELIFEFF
jgi:hypothetical protein